MSVMWMLMKQETNDRGRRGGRNPDISSDDGSFIEWVLITYVIIYYFWK